ncbi:hypothetical protein RJ640_002756 [Escallonia rubra]|uniref:Uncharacterized protein n=1 Tax=Escallonia rubra TaxID=112253 RepID=A0AA88QKS9_9ASTE|nr:hypothetical protein RJ640_002756 [Escallonia rubra]
MSFIQLDYIIYGVDHIFGPMPACLWNVTSLRYLYLGISLDDEGMRHAVFLQMPATKGWGQEPMLQRGLTEKAQFKNYMQLKGGEHNRLL